MEHLHPESQGIYRCPHCPPELKVAVPFDEVEFHLRCHGELLFKVSVVKSHKVFYKGIKSLFGLFYLNSYF